MNVARGSDRRKLAPYDNAFGGPRESVGGATCVERLVGLLTALLVDPLAKGVAGSQGKRAQKLVGIRLPATQLGQGHLEFVDRFVPA